MADDVGAFRTAPKLERAIARIDRLARDLGERPFGDRAPFDMQRIDWLDLRNMVLVARTVARAALRRTESRGAHQREDFPGMLAHWRVNQVVRWHDGAVDLTSAPPADSAVDPTADLAAAQ
jgi:succinate dehydrogenase/fumarate reductase flavoprotein subunit